MGEFPRGRCNGCMQEAELVLEESGRDPNDDTKWIKVQWCQECCDLDPLKKHLSEELNG